MQEEEEEEEGGGGGVKGVQEGSERGTHRDGVHVLAEGEGAHEWHQVGQDGQDTPQGVGAALQTDGHKRSVWL